MLAVNLHRHAGRIHHQFLGPPLPRHLRVGAATGLERFPQEGLGLQAITFPNRAPVAVRTGSPTSEGAAHTTAVCPSSGYASPLKVGGGVSGAREAPGGAGSGRPPGGAGSARAHKHQWEINRVEHGVAVTPSVL